MTAGDSALMAGLFGAIMGLIKVIEIYANRGTKRDERADVAKAASMHAPCNKAVDKLTDALHDEIKEQQAFRLSFEKWMAAEEGYRRGLRATGEYPVQP